MISIWESESFLHNNDVLIIGGGVIGLSCGLSILERFPSKRVTILERAQLPCGASTKNAGILSVGGLESFMSEVKEKGKEEAVKIFALKQESINIMLRRLEVD